jgi:tetratricopeptide (TPR) repeat protein
VRSLSPSRARSATLAVLAAGYGWLWLSLGQSSLDRRFDPLSPAGRHVEQAIESGQFADALPVALALQRSFPNQPQIWYWLAEIHHGLSQPEAEADAWTNFVSMSPARPAACPQWPEAHARAGHEAEAIQAYEQCASFAPDDPERLIDLADALASRRRVDAARAAYARAATLDRSDPRPALRLRALSPGGSR